MSHESEVFELPPLIDTLLSKLAKLFAYKNQTDLERIVVNSVPRIEEGTTYDGWDGGQNGHSLFLTIPESLYLTHFDDKAKLEQTIAENLNKLHKVKNEFIDSVSLLMPDSTNPDWRRSSGLFLPEKKQISVEASLRIWGEGSYRVFLSHKAEYKRETSALKDSLADFGISCFVAHVDIEPTKEWQDEIEKALSSMDALVALITENFHESNWTDQEIGYAVARAVPIVPVSLGKDPYGFIAKTQALRCSWDEASDRIAGLLMRDERMLDAYVRSVESCPDFETGNRISRMLPNIQKLSKEQAIRLVNAFNASSQIRGSFGFNGAKPQIFGPGLVSHLNRLGFKDFYRQEGNIFRTTD